MRSVFGGVEDERGVDPAAPRLLRRLPELYGSRFFDILLLDSLYAQAPLLKLAQQIDWDMAITLWLCEVFVWRPVSEALENRDLLEYPFTFARRLAKW